MKGTGAINLQLQRKPPTNLRPCEHRILELETDDSGCYLTGKYHCMDCDKAFDRKKLLARVKTGTYWPKTSGQVSQVK